MQTILNNYHFPKKINCELELFKMLYLYKINFVKSFKSAASLRAMVLIHIVLNLVNTFTVAN